MKFSFIKFWFELKVPSMIIKLLFLMGNDDIFKETNYNIKHPLEG